MAIDFRFIKTETLKKIAEAVKSFLTRDGESVTIENIPDLIEENYNKDLKTIVESDGSNYSKYVRLNETNLNGATQIGAYALSGWYLLKYLATPDSVLDIGNYACSGSQLETVVIGNGVTSIGSYAFKGCTSLTNLTIGKNVSSIGESAFSGCTKLEEIVIPESVTHMGDGVFSECTNLSDITVNSKIDTIGESAFSYCKSLVNLRLLYSSEVLNIESRAFDGCESLQHGGFDNVVSLGGRVFAGCTSLESVCAGEISEIPPSAFLGCTSLNSIDIASEQYTIGRSAFKDCANLSSSVMSNVLRKATQVGEQAFSNATNSDSITLPNSIVSIGNYAFSDNQNVKAVVFYKCTENSKLESIGLYAFSNCPQLSMIVFCDFDSVPTLTNPADYTLPSDCKILVPYSLYDEWIVAPNWRDIADRIGIIQSTIPTEEEE